MILTNEEQLRIPCSNVEEHEIKDLISQLEIELNQSELYGNPGVGLAAPQIGIYKNAAIIRLSKYKINLINPIITKSIGKFIFEGEGCLSFPGIIEKTNRFKEIHVQNQIEPKSFIATGLLAVVIVHEIDHLHGILLPDNAIKK